MSNEEIPAAPEPKVKYPFDEYLETCTASWGDFFKDAAINVNDTMHIAKKSAQQHSGEENPPLSEIIEITRIIMAENQRLHNNERRSRNESSV